MLKDKTVLITGGAGFLGKNLTKYLLKTDVKKIVIYSRDEAKHSNMRLEIEDKKDRIRYILGDVRDFERLKEVCQNVDYIIHAAAIKNINSSEYNPIETTMTNVNGTINVIRAACCNYVEKVIYISSDKASCPVNLYGATKFCSEKLIQNGFVYKNNYDVQLVCVRYGNIAGSTGSIIPIFKKMIAKGQKELPLTHYDMSRFFFTVDGAINLIMSAIEKGNNSDIIIPKLKSFYIRDLIKAFNCDYKITKIRQGEKLFEQMINIHECYKDFGDYYIVNPKYEMMGLDYRCDQNNFMTVEELKKEIDKIL